MFKMSFRVFDEVFIYRPREGNIFTGVYLSVHKGGGPHVTITHDTLDLTVQPLPPPPDIRHGTPFGKRAVRILLAFYRILYGLSLNNLRSGI